MENTNKFYYELKQHGTNTLPIALYEGETTNIKNVYIHHHEELEIIYVVEGKCKVKIEGKNINGSKHDMIFIPRNALHYIEEVPSEHCFQYCTIVFNPSFINLQESSSIKDFLLKPLINGEKRVVYKIASTDENHDEIENNYLSIINNFRNKKSPLLLISDFYKFIYCLNEYHFIMEEKNKESHNNELDIILAYLQEHYCEEIKVSYLANLINYSESYLMHKFKQWTDYSITEYLLNLKLEKARSLIITTKLSINEIGTQIGIFDISYFIKKFKNKYFLTPLQYRYKK